MNDDAALRDYRSRMSTHLQKRQALKFYLREWRNHVGLSQTELALRMDTNKGQISKLETGKQRMNEDWVNRAAFALGIEPNDLFRPPLVAEASKIFELLPADDQRTIVDMMTSLAARRTAA